MGSNPQSQLPIGAHLVTPRKGYSHHGIYVGEQRVVHYAGYWYGGRRGPVEAIALEAFARGAGFWVEPTAACRYSGAEIAARALARVGEDRYSMLRNNCEHFCAWCTTGVPHSPQVEWLLAHPRRSLGIAIAAIQEALVERLALRSEQA